MAGRAPSSLRHPSPWGAYPNAEALAALDNFNVSRKISPGSGLGWGSDRVAPKSPHPRNDTKVLTRFRNRHKLSPPKNEGHPQARRRPGRELRRVAKDSDG